MQQTRRAMETAWVVAASERIQNRVIALPAFKKARAVGCYMALPYEVQTRKIIESCWAAGKRVCAPAWIEERERYELVWIEPGTPTRPGRWTIHEPASRNRAGLMDLDLLVVPALAYDRHGGRLGHGGGHFDRILGSWSGFKVGIAFEFQVFDAIPMGSQDVPVDVVVTEKTTYGQELDLTEQEP